MTDGSGGAALPAAPAAELWDDWEDDAGEAEPRVETRRLMVFEVGAHVFACEMESVREVVPSPPATRLPGTPREVRGLINLRGTIVTVVDVGYKLSRSHFNRADGLVLLIDYEEKLVGVGVDDVRDILDVPVDRISALGKLNEADSHVVTSVADIEGREVMVLDVKAVVKEVLG